MPGFVGVPVADTGELGDLGEPPVECVAGVGPAVFVAEDQAVVLPGFAGGETLGGLAFPVRPKSLYGSPWA